MVKKYAISIGINIYEHMPELKYARQDAQLMDSWFEKSGFAARYLFTDNSQSTQGDRQHYEATFGNLKALFLKRFKPNTLEIEDSIWFFFSGHGIRHEGIDYLMPRYANSDPEGIKDTAISVNYISQRLRETGAGDVVILCDACRDRSKGDDFKLDQVKGVITLASCSPNERSYEIDELMQGAFTYALHEALESTQQGNGNYATFERLYQRLQVRVPELNREFNQGKPRYQNPSGHVDPDEKRHCILLPKHAIKADIAIYEKQALIAEVNNNYLEAERILIKLWEICPGDSEIRQFYKRVVIKQDRELQAQSVTSARSETVIEEPAKVTVFLQTKEASQAKDPVQQNFVEQLGSETKLEMVYIPGGSFMMGSPEEEEDAHDKPQHKVTISAFFMSKYPVTQAQWQAIRNNNPARFLNNPQNPIETVTWNDAQEFCKKLSNKTRNKYRLPSEAEWEYACRAGTTTRYCFGKTLTKNLANYDKNVRKTTPVGKFPANAFGLHDMHGNVWEWCKDNWHDNYKKAPTNGRAWIDNKSSTKVTRGGSWSNFPGSCCSTSRSYFLSEYDSDIIGFRVVCKVPRTR